MTNVWLISITEGADCKSVYKKDTEADALQFVGAVIIGQIVGTTINNIFAIDTEAGTMTEMEPAVSGLVLTFREKGTA